MSKLKRFLNRIRRLLRRPLYQKGLLLEAFLFLFLARAAVVCLPFKRIADWSGVQDEETEYSPSAEQVALEIRWAVFTASKHGWWNCLCLTQAIAAKAMLRRRGCRSTLYIGLTRPSSKSFSAHAWLKCGRVFVTGEKDHECFTPIVDLTESLTA